MNLQPIHPKEPPFNFTCTACSRPCLSAADGARADLDAAPGTYYCPPCALRRAERERAGRRYYRALARGITGLDAERAYRGL